MNKTFGERKRNTIEVEKCKNLLSYGSLELSFTNISFQLTDVLASMDFGMSIRRGCSSSITLPKTKMCSIWVCFKKMGSCRWTCIFKDILHCTIFSIRSCKLLGRYRKFNGVAKEKKKRHFCVPSPLEALSVSLGELTFFFYDGKS